MTRTTTTTTTTDYPVWLQCDWYKAESLVRVALASIFGCTVTVWDHVEGTYVPHTGKLMIGCFASFLPLFYPKLVYGICGIAPYDSTMMLWCCGIATLLHSICVHYGQPAMLLVYSVYIFFMTMSLFFTTVVVADPATATATTTTASFHQKTSGFVGFYTGIASMLTISFLSKVDYPDNENTPNSGSPLLTVTEMWTNSGISNPNAIYRNFLINWCYAQLCVIVMIIIPFPRTGRSLVTKTIIPTIIRDIIDYVEPLTTDEDDDDDTKNGGTMIHRAFELRSNHLQIAKMTKYEPRLWKNNENLVIPLTALLNDLNLLAKCAVFRHSSEVLGMLLEDDYRNSNTTNNDIDNINDGNANEHRRCPLVLELCIDALQNSSNSRSNNTNTALERLRNSPSTLERYTRAMIDDRTENQDYHHETLHSYGTRYFLEKAERVKQSTIAYLDCLEDTTATTTTFTSSTFLDVVKNRVEFNLMWIIEPLLTILSRLYQTIGIVLTAKSPLQWDWSTLGWSLEYSMGFVLLFGMNLYLPNYASLGVDSASQHYFTLSTHQGWDLLGYAMAFRPTVEGTVKKGLMRIVGTILGGSIGWIGSIVCSGFSDDKLATMNPYGTVIWTTFFTVLGAYFSTDAGPQGLFGATYSHGFLGFYFCLVQALVMLTVYTQPGTRNVVTVTRVVATSFGVAVAIIVQLIPPNIYGRYPRDIVPCLREIQNIFQSTIDAALSLHHNTPCRNPADKDDTSNAHVDEGAPLIVSSLYETVVVSGKIRQQIEAVQNVLDHRLFLANDAGTLSCLPLMNINPRIIPLLKEMTITVDYVSRLEDIVSGLKDNPHRDSLVQELYTVMHLGRRPAPIHTTTIISGSVATNTELLKNVLDGTSLFPGICHMVQNRLTEHERELQSLF